MELSDFLDVEDLKALIASGHINRRNHPTLPMAILNYSNKCTFDNFWPDTAQKCRGLIINPKPNHEICGNCQIVSLPFRKFFNLNDSGHPESLESNLPDTNPTVTEKMDGWFGIQWKCGDQYGIASRGSFESPGAIFATEKLQKLVKYGAIEEFPKGYTPIYEIIFKAGKIVVDYPYEGLVLLALINNETGEELLYDELRNVWAKIAAYSADNRPWIRLVKAHNLGLDQVKGIDNSWDVKNQEGFVLTYQRLGTHPIKVKVKFEDYKRLHKLITGVTPKKLWSEIHDPLSLWLGEGIPDHFRKWVIRWRDDFYLKFHNDLVSAINAAHNTANHLPTASRKEIFQYLEEIYPKIATVAMAILDGKIHEAHKQIWAGIKPISNEEETFYSDGARE